MKQYKMITMDDVKDMTLAELIQKYNDAVSEIWYLSYKIKELNEEVDLWQAAYDQVSDELYG